MLVICFHGTLPSDQENENLSSYGEEQIAPVGKPFIRHRTGKQIQCMMLYQVWTTETVTQEHTVHHFA